MINMPRTITGSCSPIRCKHTLDILPVSVYINPMYAEKCLRQWQRAPVSIHSVPVYPAQGHGGWSRSQLRLGKTCTCWANHQPVTGPTRKATFNPHRSAERKAAYGYRTNSAPFPVSSHRQPRRCLRFIV